MTVQKTKSNNDIKLAKMNNYRDEYQEDEILLSEIVSFFKESWRQLLLGGVLGGMIGLSFALLRPSIYQVTANIQVAKVAGIEVEAPNILLEKLKMPLYYSPRTIVECGLDNSVEPGSAIAAELNPVLIKGAPIIKISYKDKNIDEAKKCLESVLRDIQVNQNEIAKPILEKKKSQLSDLRNKIESAERVIKVLSSKISNYDKSDQQFSASALLLATIFSKENEVKEMQAKINILEMELAEPNTKQSSLITPIYSPNIPLERKKSEVFLVSFIGGAFLVLLFVIFRRRFTQDVK